MKPQDLKKQQLDQKRLRVVKKNMRKFIKEKGFLLLHNCINLVFKELSETNDSKQAQLLDQGFIY